VPGGAGMAAFQVPQLTGFQKTDSLATIISHLNLIHTNGYIFDNLDLADLQ
jgi:hypothetical protein